MSENDHIDELIRENKRQPFLQDTSMQETGQDGSVSEPLSDEELAKLQRYASELIATQNEVLAMPAEQSDWFMSKPGHVAAFDLAWFVNIKLEPLVREVRELRAERDQAQKREHEANARAAVVINGFKALQKYEDGEIDQQTLESIIKGMERDLNRAAEWLGEYVNAGISRIAELERDLKKEEASCLEIIDERDKREGQILTIATILAETEEPPEWSNLHDLGDEAEDWALELIAERDQLKTQLAAGWEQSVDVGVIVDLKAQLAEALKPFVELEWHSEVVVNHAAVALPVWGAFHMAGKELSEEARAALANLAEEPKP